MNEHAIVADRFFRIPLIPENLLSFNTEDEFHVTEMLYAEHVTPN